MEKSQCSISMFKGYYVYYIMLYYVYYIILYYIILYYIVYVCIYKVILKVSEPILRQCQ